MNRLCAVRMGNAVCELPENNVERAYQLRAAAGCQGTLEIIAKTGDAPHIGLPICSSTL